MAKLPRPVRPLADVNILDPRPDGGREVVVCFMPDRIALFGEDLARAFIALDASASMREVYGYGQPFGGSPNYVQKIARKLASNLAEITHSGTVGMIFWAVSADGNKIEEIGELDEPGWMNTPLSGPRQQKWGRGTRLLPAVRYGVDRIAAHADHTLGVILTDGRFDDLTEVEDYSLDLGRQIVAGKRKPLKLILIGVGEEVDAAQLERLDNLFEGTGIDYDLYSSGLVQSMECEDDILAVLYGELISDRKVIWPHGHVEDGTGKVLRRWTDGMPGKFRFILPAGQRRFVIHTPGNNVVQDIPPYLLGATGAP